MCDWHNHNSNENSNKAYGFATAGSESFHDTDLSQGDWNWTFSNHHELTHADSHNNSIRNSISGLNGNRVGAHNIHVNAVARQAAIDAPTMAVIMVSIFLALGAFALLTAFGVALAWLSLVIPVLAFLYLGYRRYVTDKTFDFLTYQLELQHEREMRKLGVIESAVETGVPNMVSTFTGNVVPGGERQYRMGGEQNWQVLPPRGERPLLTDRNERDIYADLIEQWKQDRERVQEGIIVR